MINETCPYCGAVQSDLQYEEELDWGDDRIEESLTCLRNQIAAQIAEIERLKTVLTHIRDHGGTTDDESGLSHNGSWCAEQARCALEVEK